MTATDQIRKAYSVYETQFGARSWMSITEITHRTDLTLEQIHTGLAELARSRQIDLVGRPDQMNLTTEDRANRMWFGEDWNDLISIR